MSFIFHKNIKIDLNKSIRNFAPPHVKINFPIKLFKIDILAFYNRCWMVMWQVLSPTWSVPWNSLDRYLPAFGSFIFYHFLNELFSFDRSVHMKCTTKVLKKDWKNHTGHTWNLNSLVFYRLYDIIFLEIHKSTLLYKLLILTSMNCLFYHIRELYRICEHFRIHVQYLCVNSTIHPDYKLLTLIPLVVCEMQNQMH